MNAANVIPLSAPHAAPDAKSEHPAALNPVRVRFDAFELDEPNALLLRNGKAVTLAPKPFGVLCALARRPGSLLTKHALLDDVWGHQFVTDSVLKTGHQRGACGARRRPETAALHRDGIAARLSLHRSPRLARRRNARLPSSGTSRLGATIPPLRHSRHCAAATRRSPSSSARSPPRWSASRLSSTSPSRECVA